MSKQLVALALCLAAWTLAGCGLEDPYAKETVHAARSPLPPRARHLPDVGRTPTQALARFTEVYVNWTAATLEAQQRKLALMSIGAARAGALRAADAAVRDPTRRRAGVRNRGSVISIAPGRARARGRWVVVTMETTTGTGAYAGLPPDSIHVTYATVQRTDHGFIVSSWSPRS